MLCWDDPICCISLAWPLSHRNSGYSGSLGNNLVGFEGLRAFQVLRVDGDVASGIEGKQFSRVFFCNDSSIIMY
jgi:hypothetical protein